MFERGVSNKKDGNDVPSNHVSRIQCTIIAEKAGGSGISILASRLPECEGDKRGRSLCISAPLPNCNKRPGTRQRNHPEV